MLIFSFFTRLMTNLVPKTALSHQSMEFLKNAKHLMRHTEHTKALFLSRLKIARMMRFDFCCRLLVFFPPMAYSWTLQLPSIRTQYERGKKVVTFSAGSDFLDVEFEKISPESKEENTSDETLLENDGSEDELSELLENGKNLIDLSLEAGDPRWKETRIPFCRGTEFIDCKLAFMVDLEGQSYGIGVPFDDVVAIVVQGGGKKAKYSMEENTNIEKIDPDAYEDNEEYAELMQIFARQVQEQLGEEYQLRKTPKVLTISGGLDKITKNWESKVVTKPFDVDELIEISKPKNQDDLDKELKSFFNFMRNELGDEEFEKTMNGDDDVNALEAEFKDMMGLFDVPLAESADMEDSEALEDLMQSIANDIETGEVSEAKEFIPDTKNAALKLLGYTFRDSGKSYFLVKPLQPYTMVGRHVKDEEEYIRFELLTPEEEKVIAPKLEEICREDLEANGLSFSSNATTY